MSCGVSRSVDGPAVGHHRLNIALTDQFQGRELTEQIGISVSIEGKVFRPGFKWMSLGGGK